MNELNKDVIKFKFKQDAINVKVSCLLDEDFAKASFTHWDKKYSFVQNQFQCNCQILDFLAFNPFLNFHPFCDVNQFLEQNLFLAQCVVCLNNSNWKGLINHASAIKSKVKIPAMHWDSLR